MKLNKATILISVLAGVGLIYFFINIQPENIQNQRHPAQSVSVARTTPKAIDQQVGKEKSLITEDELNDLINSFFGPENFEKLRLKVNQLSNSDLKKIVNYFSLHLYPVSDLKFTLRGLDFLKLIFEKDSLVVTSESQQVLKNLLLDNNPMIVRGALRVIATLNTEEALGLLASSVNQEDSSISAEVMNIIATKMNQHAGYFLTANLDQKIIEKVQYFETHGQGTLEVSASSIQVLTKLKSNVSLAYLADKIKSSDLNLNLKNEIAKSLPAWGQVSLNILEYYHAYLLTLRKEANPMIDRDRIEGLQITAEALKKIKNK
ncbi:MAG: hypothetical protein B7Y39_18100 [Bdellovibrio sp. 28-41-41]|nr:MAG: hypothetical protein B7Y39_18100 [Bdellovibrio sp. 28-41-41]